MIAMWVIINLPTHLKLIVKILLRNYNSDKNTASLKNLWEEFCLYTQRKNNRTNSNSSALVSIQRNLPISSSNDLPQQNTNESHFSNLFNSNLPQENQFKNFPLCAPGWHHPLSKHKEEGFSYLKPKISKPTVALKTQATNLSDSVIILDLGANESMFKKLSYFIDFNESPRKIVLENGSQITAKGIGTVKIELPYLHLKIKDTLYCPELSNCLLSMGLLLKNDCTLQPASKNKLQILN
ncbi:hypothetical protein O181_065017 [Austropuccinia psidii MF-1]|uniref:Retrovirus-related Pol polyprotein from transposon TNT 1-94-like beta-barrel domain-containing protein n=1 Tax=Austropuccinia psidii MF-1 TaxID=1389203 RepID=A0A9Q3EWQ7_9BASI|nr:hypothetical protein [Austropuccinia psidii MF-1]